MLHTFIGINQTHFPIQKKEEKKHIEKLILRKRESVTLQIQRCSRAHRSAPKLRESQRDVRVGAWSAVGNYPTPFYPALISISCAAPLHIHKPNVHPHNWLYMVELIIKTTWNLLLHIFHELHDSRRRFKLNTRRCWHVFYSRSYLDFFSLYINQVHFRPTVFIIRVTYVWHRWNWFLLLFSSAAHLMLISSLVTEGKMPPRSHSRLICCRSASKHVFPCTSCCGWSGRVAVFLLLWVQKLSS